MSSIIRWRSGVVGRDAVVMVIAPELEVRDEKPPFMMAQAAGDYADRAVRIRLR